jgi:hypothetical protein
VNNRTIYCGICRRDTTSDGKRMSELQHTTAACSVVQAGGNSAV